MFLETLVMAEESVFQDDIYNSKYSKPSNAQGETMAKLSKISYEEFLVPHVPISNTLQDEECHDEEFV
jgi:hypothetical protein